MRIIWFTTIILVLPLLIIGCSSDDGISDSDKKESFKIKVVGIEATQMPSSEGGILEVYGTIRAKVIFPDNGERDEHILWSRDANNWIPIGLAETVIDSEDSEYVISLTEDEILEGALIEIYVYMEDKDPEGNPDDFIGSSTVLNSASAFTMVSDTDNPVLMQFNLIANTQMRLLVRFTIEHLRN